MGIGEAFVVEVTLDQNRVAKGPWLFDATRLLVAISEILLTSAVDEPKIERPAHPKLRKLTSSTSLPVIVSTSK
jgi:hypothetical protein